MRGEMQGRKLGHYSDYFGDMKQHSHSLRWRPLLGLFKLYAPRKRHPIASFNQYLSYGWTATHIVA
jgi:hypothetical protein